MKVSIGGVGVRLMLRAGTIAHELPAVWLRERSPEPGQFDAITGQRLFNPHLFPTDLRIDVAVQSGDTLSVRFSDGHVADYDCNELRRQITALNVLPRRSVWRGDLSPLPYHSMLKLQASRGHRAALADLLKFGFVVLTGIEAETDSLNRIAGYFGTLRDPVTRPYLNGHVNGSFPAPAPRRLSSGPHTAHAFRDPVPGFKIIYCAGSLGHTSTSLLVDGLAIVDRMRREDPESSRLLSEIAVSFRFRDRNNDYVSNRPIIELNDRGGVETIAYNPMIDELPLMSANLTHQYQAARRRFSELVVHPDFALTCVLPPGQAIVIDNQRVLHNHLAEQSAATTYIGTLEGDGPAGRYRRESGVGYGASRSSNQPDSVRR